MSSDLATNLDRLRKDFQRVTGKPFEHFYCPFLYRDEDVELCRGHVINSAFADSDRTWIAQRKDVDDFYGRVFESEFVNLGYRGRQSPVDALVDKNLFRRLRPEIQVEGENVDFYHPADRTPPTHTNITLETPERAVHLTIKMAPSDVLARASGSWEIIINRDVRIEALASLLKAAHLTLFDLIGYTYALSAAGRFLGWDVLGRFADSNFGRKTSHVRQDAYGHFSQFANMARPILSGADELSGTVTDGLLYLCKTAAWPWAVLVILKTDLHRHAVLVPIFENEHAIARYLQFLKSPDPVIECFLTRYREDKWEVSTTPITMNWPPAKLM